MAIGESCIEIFYHIVHRFGDHSPVDVTSYRYWTWTCDLRYVNGLRHLLRNTPAPALPWYARIRVQIPNKDLFSCSQNCLYLPASIPICWNLFTHVRRCEDLLQTMGVDRYDQTGGCNSSTIRQYYILMS